MELQILDAMQSIRNPVLDAVMVFISDIGNVGAVWIALALVLLAVPKTRRAGLIVAAAGAVDVVLCNGILKNLFQRVRPCDVNTAVQLLVPRPADFSFPSGHTAASFAAVEALYFAGMKKLWKPTLFLAIAMGFSRMYLYVHYPSDIIGGIIVGTASGYIGYRIVCAFLDWKGRREKEEKLPHRVV